ncbi:MAG: PHP domain-containing protein [Geopsychrobacter sp.]|nr:PHP domain-containing protein [Geopsychrobacter sp.]
MTTQQVDLHLHTSCSDGRYSPAEVVAMAAAAGMKVIAIADHDNVDGIDRALCAGAEHGIEVISAVELSTQWQDYQDIHLLGYGFDHHHVELVHQLAGFREFRAGRNQQIVTKVNSQLAEEGREPLDFEAIAASAAGTIGRPHIALALRSAGYVQNHDEAFDRYLVPNDVVKRFFPIDEAIRLIHAAGGIAVLAHPPYVTRNHGELEALLETFVEMGLDGLEAYNNGVNQDGTYWLINLARRHDLIVTGGSDFHGSEDSTIAIGRGVGRLKIPYTCVDEIRSALFRRHAEENS